MADANHAIELFPIMWTFFPKSLNKYGARESEAYDE